eukprot:10377310-Alexandrium_andersonii.AAC.1
MSASLVGSEMCIRDSNLTVTVQKHSPSALPGGRRGVHSLHCRVSTAPVSYTHLTLPTICSV